MAFQSVFGGGKPSGPSTRSVVEDTSSPDDILGSLMSGDMDVDGNMAQAAAADEDGEDSQEDAHVSDDSAESSPLDENDGIELPDELKEPAANAQEIEIKADGKSHKFKLDPNDKKLKQTLEWGKAAPRFVRERKEAIRRAETAEAELAAKSSDLSRLAELDDIRATNPTLAIKHLLGDEGYKKFFNDTVFARVRYELAKSDDPEQAAQIAQKFLDQEREDERFLTNREIKKRDDKLAQMELKETAIAQRAIAESEWNRFNFANITQDENEQDNLAQKLWKLTMADVEEFMTDHKAKNNGKLPTLTREQYRAALTENYKFLVGTRKKVGEVKAKTADKRQEVEKKKAAEVARKQAPKGQAKTEDKFNSMNALERFNFLQRK